MARATMQGSRVIDSVRASIPLFATDAGQDLLKGIQERQILVGIAVDDAYWTAIAAAVQVYIENPPTAADSERILAHYAEIDKQQAQIKKISAGITKKLADQIAKAASGGDTAKTIELTVKMQKDIAAQTKSQQDAVRIEEKCIADIENKQIDLAVAKFTEISGVHEGSDEESAGSSKHPWKEQRFRVNPTRVTPWDGESLAYAVKMYADEKTRRIWVTFVGDGYDPQMREETAKNPLFAGFWIDSSEKKAVKSKSALCNYNYAWITVASSVRPKSQQDCFEVTKRCNLRIENGNGDTDYSGGAEYAQRIVEAYDSSAGDVGKQVLAQDMPEIDWDALDAHKALINAEIDAEVSSDGENAADAESDDAEVADTAKKAA